MGLKSLAEIDITSKLMTNPFFQEFPVDLVEQLGPMVRFEQVPSHALILEQGKSNSFLYILNSGRVSVVVDGEKVAQMERRGDLIGEMSVITNKPCSATIISETPVELITILAGDFAKVDDGDDSRFHGALYRTFAMILTDKLSKTNEKARRFEVTNRNLQELQKQLEVANADLETKVAQRTKELAESNELMQQLLDNLDQGFLMLNNEFRTEAIYTAAAKRFFGNELEGKNLAEVFGLKGSQAQTVLEWVELGFSNQLPFDSVRDLGPTKYSRGSNHISLEYRPVYKDDSKSLDKIILIATDKSEEFALKERAKSEQDLVQLAISVMRDRSSFVDFVHDLRRIFANALNEIKKGSGKAKIPDIFRWLHTIKGGMASYHLNRLADDAHKIEDQLAILRNLTETPKSETFAAIENSIAQLYEGFERFLSDQERILGKVEQDVGRQRTYSTKQFLEFAEHFRNLQGASGLYESFIEEFVLEDIANGFYQFEDLVRSVAERQSKVVAFRIESANVRVYLPNYKSLIGSFVHLFRNAVDHGIELPDERSLNGKSESGNIVVRFLNFVRDSMAWVRIEVQDDGRGLSIERVRQKCVEKGLVSSNDAASMTDNQVMQFIFVEGFSTRDGVNEYSGRGVGLDAIKNEAKQLGGVVRVESEAGIGTLFIIEVPMMTEVLELTSDEEAA